MPKSRGGGGNGGRSGGGAGSGDAGQPGEVVRAANQLRGGSPSTRETLSKISKIDADIARAEQAYSAATSRGDREARKEIRKQMSMLEMAKGKLKQDLLK